MEEEELRNYITAGEIAFKAKQYALKIVSPGKSLLSVADEIEKYILEWGAGLAFPVNVSVNQIAAHRTPLVDDEELIPENSVVKVDLGVHVHGYIADTALTVIFNEKYVKLGEAVKKALEKGLSEVKPGVRFTDAGRVIEKTIRVAGYKVIKNLTGHSLDRYQIHAGESIPNYKDPFNRGRFRKDKAYAMEPFGTDGKGWIKEVHSSVQIYALRKPISEENFPSGLGDVEEEVLAHVIKEFRTLPFCERWLRPEIKKFGVNGVRNALNMLSGKGFLFKYPVLVEVGRGYVVQFEETFVVTDEGILITTNPELNETIKNRRRTR
ncbi:MAG: type II methionyl aminopeptidase [Desulfurococcales archaeon]|nr:type II methionyl aminopeptidase [Desulfurococcales archaeon]